MNTKTKTPKPEAAAKDQKEYLEARLNEAHPTGYSAMPKREEPADVLEARSIIHRYEQADEEAEKKWVHKVRKERQKVREKILFSAAEEALAAVQAFEELEFPFPTVSY